MAAEGEFPKADGDVLFASDTNFLADSVSYNILNKLRQQQDRSVEISNNKEDIFSDAYIDADGRENTVNTGNTTANYFSGDSSYEVDNATTGITTQTQTDSRTGSVSTSSSERNFEITGDCNQPLIITSVTIRCAPSGSGTFAIYIDKNGTQVASKVSTFSAGNLVTTTFALSDYSATLTTGDTWGVRYASGNNLYVETSPQTYTGTLFDGSTMVNITVPCNGFSMTATNIQGSTSTSNIIEHDIPSGTFSSTVSTLFGKSFITNTEGDAKIEHKLSNATEDSGYFEDGERGAFTAFTSEPTKYTVRLTSRTSGTPSPGYPRIKGSGVVSK